MLVKLIQNSVVAPKGFKAAGIYSQVKKKNKDMAIIYSEEPCNYAGAFTQNHVKAAPVKWDEGRLKEQQPVHGIIINSGNANALTGEAGEKDTYEMAKLTAKCLGVHTKEILVASTGVIGVPLPMEKIKKGIETITVRLEDTPQAANDCAQGILTTDTFQKDIAIEVKEGNSTYRIGAIGKGSGMIHPNMATMLCFVTTDVAITKELLQKALISGVNETFNCITVDGDTSTNDSVMVLANGCANTPLIETEGEAFDTFCKALYEVLKYMAIAIIKDGEGATKLLEVQIQGALSKEKGKQLAKSILTSNLVKTAFFGEDANWGRIIAAMGNSGEHFEVENLCLTIESEAGKSKLFNKGEPVKFNEQRAKKILQEREITVIVKLHEGEADVTAWGCDLSYDYIKINGDYRS